MSKPILSDYAIRKLRRQLLHATTPHPQKNPDPHLLRRIIIIRQHSKSKYPAFRKSVGWSLGGKGMVKWIEENWGHVLFHGSVSKALAWLESL